MIKSSKVIKYIELGIITFCVLAVLVVVSCTETRRNKIVEINSIIDTQKYMDNSTKINQDNSAPENIDGSTIETTPSVPIDGSKIEITPITVIDGIQWKLNSKQNLSWSVKGLPTGKFSTVISLEAVDPEMMSGVIIHEPTKVGVNEVSYKVGIIVVGGDALQSLVPGTYNVVFSIFRPEEGPSRFASYGDFVMQKNVGKVVIVE